MRLKLLKEKIYLTDVIRDIFSKADKSVNTSITVDVNGGITLENFKKYLDFLTVAFLKCNCIVECSCEHDLILN